MPFLRRDADQPPPRHGRQGGAHRLDGAGGEQDRSGAQAQPAPPATRAAARREHAREPFFSGPVARRRRAERASRREASAEVEPVVEPTVEPVPAAAAVEPPPVEPIVAVDPAGPGSVPTDSAAVEPVPAAQDAVAPGTARVPAEPAGPLPVGAGVDVDEPAAAGTVPDAPLARAAEARLVGAEGDAPVADAERPEAEQPDDEQPEAQQPDAEQPDAERATPLAGADHVPDVAADATPVALAQEPAVASRSVEGGAEPADHAPGAPAAAPTDEAPAASPPERGLDPRALAAMEAARRRPVPLFDQESLDDSPQLPAPVAAPHPVIGQPYPPDEPFDQTAAQAPTGPVAPVAPDAAGAWPAVPTDEPGRSSTPLAAEYFAPVDTPSHPDAAATGPHDVVFGGDVEPDVPTPDAPLDDAPEGDAQPPVAEEPAMPLRRSDLPRSVRMRDEPEEPLDGPQPPGRHERPRPERGGWRRRGRSSRHSGGQHRPSQVAAAERDQAAEAVVASEPVESVAAPVTQVLPPVEAPSGVVVPATTVLPRVVPAASVEPFDQMASFTTDEPQIVLSDAPQPVADELQGSSSGPSEPTPPQEAESETTPAPWQRVLPPIIRPLDPAPRSRTRSEQPESEPVVSDESEAVPAEQSEPEPVVSGQSEESVASEQSEERVVPEAPESEPVVSGQSESEPVSVDGLAPGVVARVRGLRKEFSDPDGVRTALDGVDLAVERGRLVTVTGPAGAGASTLVRVLAGLETPTAGDVVLAGPARVGMIFAGQGLVPILTARENIVLPFVAAGVAVEASWFDDVVAATGVGDVLDRRADALTPEAAARVACARALAGRPALVVADAPTDDLADDDAVPFLDVLRRVVDDLGVSVVHVTHRPDAVARGDRVVMLAAGRVVGVLDGPLDRPRPAGTHAS